MKTIGTRCKIKSTFTSRHVTHKFLFFSFDDNGDCLDPKMMEELTTAVGKVTIETPKSNYKAYQANVDLLSGEEYPHVLECSNFPAEFRTQDLMMMFSQYKESGFDIKWVDDTHCLVVFSNAKIGESRFIDQLVHWDLRSDNNSSCWSADHEPFVCKIEAFEGINSWVTFEGEVSSRSLGLCMSAT